MLAQRATQQTLRRLASKPSIATQMTFRKIAGPMAMSSTVQTRPVATQNLTPKDSYEILVAQRKLRPVAPHLSIYQPQIPWILSSFNRITGVTLSGVTYLFALAYLASPLTGGGLDSASLAAGFAAWPLVAKVAAKFTLALPFTFHSLQGVRHLVWDSGRQLKNIQVIRSGQAVIGLSLVSALGLAVLM